MSPCLISYKIFQSQQVSFDDDFGSMEADMQQNDFFRLRNYMPFQPLKFMNIEGVSFDIVQ